MRKSSRVYSCAKNIQKLIYPSSCQLCGAAGEGELDLCRACRLELPYNRVACRLCGLPLTGQEGGLCGSCLQRPPPLDGTIAAFRYEAPLDALLLGLKFNRQLSYARLLGGLLADTIEQQCDELPDCIVPVPLHPGRLRERGYNQALELARSLAARSGIAIAQQLVRRVKATEAQSGLEKKARRKNIKGVFAVQGELPAHIAIVDDVVTTGSTVNELARALRRAGARRVVVWACARVTL